MTDPNPYRSYTTSELREEDWKYCSNCHSKIAREGWKATVDGSYLHNFVNPLGIEFRILTFSKVIGMLWHTNSFSEHTWFPGFSWRIGQCENCGSHLGWAFESDTEQVRFFGIILDRISGGSQ